MLHNATDDIIHPSAIFKLMTSIPVLYLDMISSNLVLYLDFNDVIKLASYFTDQFKVNTLFEISFSSYCNYYYYYFWYCFCQFAFLYFFLFIPRIFFWVEKWNFFSVCVQVQSKMGNIEKLTVTFVPEFQICMVSNNGIPCILVQG